MIKSKRVVWTGHVARMEEMQYANKILVWKLNNVEGGIILLNLNIKKWTWVYDVVSSGLGWDAVVGVCEHSSEPSGSVKGVGI
jgi:hypothetical protein